MAPSSSRQCQPQHLQHQRVHLRSPFKQFPSPHRRPRPLRRRCSSNFIRFRSLASFRRSLPARGSSRSRRHPPGTNLPLRSLRRRKPHGRPRDVKLLHLATIPVLWHRTRQSQWKCNQHREPNSRNPNCNRIYRSNSLESGTRLQCVCHRLLCLCPGREVSF